MTFDMLIRADDLACRMDVRAEQNSSIMQAELEDHEPTELYPSLAKCPFEILGTRLIISMPNVVIQFDAQDIASPVSPYITPKRHRGTRKLKVASMPTKIGAVSLRSQEIRYHGEHYHSEASCNSLTMSLHRYSPSQPHPNP